MSRAHLTDVVVQRLKAIGIYYDTTNPAFGVRVGKNLKTWVITRGADRQRISIGHYPAMSLADARKEARRCLAEPETRGKGMKFSVAFDLFKAQHIAGKKPRTQYDYTRTLEKHLLPKLGSRRLDNIAYEDVIALTDMLPPSEKAHCLAVGRTFLRWCVKPPRRYLSHSPLEGVEIKLGKARKRVLNPQELKAVWLAAGNQGYPHGTLVQLLISTGQRRGEIANLRRPWINEKDRTITLPDWVTKNSKEHTFPYGELVASILKAIPRYNDTELLFPSRASGERPISGWSKYKIEMNAPVEGWTLHDLRRTYRSFHAEIGTGREIAERLINHAAGVMTDVEAIYDRWHYLPQMRAAIAAFEAHLSALTSSQPDISQAA
jgi:integrase